MKVYVDALASGQGHDAFYTNAAIKTAYKNYVRAVVSRYTTSPAIFAWELSNEARCAGALAQSGSCTPARVTAWISEMAAYIKTLDSNHMVTDGTEGFFNRAGNSDWFYNGGEGVDFEAILKLGSIDFATFHLYPSHWSKDVSFKISPVRLFKIDTDYISIPGEQPLLPTTAQPPKQLENLSFLRNTVFPVPLANVIL